MEVVGRSGPVAGQTGWYHGDLTVVSSSLMDEAQPFFLLGVFHFGCSLGPCARWTACETPTRGYATSHHLKHSLFYLRKE